MKRPKLLLFLLLLASFFTFSDCKKNKPNNPVDELPPETQTGANTFGCLVDGKVFIPKGDPFGGPIKKAAYQFVNGGYYFNISGSRSSGDEVSSVSVFGDSSIISVGSFNLGKRKVAGLMSGQYLYSKIGTLGNSYYTNEINRGEIVVTKFDQTKQIVSGTFWFDAIDSTTGKIIQIREGRFDMPFVR